MTAPCDRCGRPSWQPMVSAPRDGTRVLVCVDSPHWIRVEIALWYRDAWHQDTERATRTVGTPVAWAPLPKVPRP